MYPEPFSDYKEVAEAKAKGEEAEIAMMGGVSPIFYLNKNGFYFDIIKPNFYREPSYTLLLIYTEC